MCIEFHIEHWDHKSNVKVYRAREALQDTHRHFRLHFEQSRNFAIVSGFSPPKGNFQKTTLGFAADGFWLYLFEKMGGGVIDIRMFFSLSFPHSLSFSLHIYICIHIYIYLLNMGTRRSRPYYKNKSSFWPPAEIIMIMVIVVRARNYSCNYIWCGARQKW